MSEKKVLSLLEQGIIACKGNARRLIDDAETLLLNNRYLSCFLLSELALEEMGKTVELLKKFKNNEKFTGKEWEQLTKKGRGSHIRKLKYAHEFDDTWLAKVMKGSGMSYEEFEEGYLKNLPSIKDMDEFREKYSRMYYNRRLSTLYVDYDFERKQWIDPLKSLVAKDLHFSLKGLVRAKHVLSLLEQAIEYAMKYERKKT